MRGDATSNQAFQDWTLACPHRHLGALLLLSDLLAATAGTPALGRLLLTLLGRATASALGCRLLGGLAAGATTALRGGLLGATLLGCHADKNFCKRVTQINEFLMRTKEESEFPSIVQKNLRAINLPNPTYFSN